jgi:hypothetical protein
MEQVLFQFP